MRIRFEEPFVAEDLISYFRRSECLVERIDDHVVDVSPKQTLLSHAVRLEIEGLLRVWCRRHEGVRAVLIEPDHPRPA